jgi:hypothetical protein
VKPLYVVLYELPSGWWGSCLTTRSKRKAKQYATREQLRTEWKHRVFKKI